MAEEGLEATKHDKIHIAEPMDIDMEKVEYKLERLMTLINTLTNEDLGEIKNTIKEIVPTFKEGEQVNKARIEENKKIDIGKNVEKLKLLVNTDNKEKITA